jgi:hypothetical protein
MRPGLALLLDLERTQLGEMEIFIFHSSGQPICAKGVVEVGGRAR